MYGRIVSVSLNNNSYHLVRVLEYVLVKGQLKVEVVYLQLLKKVVVLQVLVQLQHLLLLHLHYVLVRIIWLKMKTHISKVIRILTVMVWFKLNH